jgi:hypothetical protein
MMILLILNVCQVIKERKMLVITLAQLELLQIKLANVLVELDFILTQINVKRL